MMRHILETAQYVIDEFGGNNIFVTAENTGAKVWYRTLGRLKGFYVCEKESRYIVINRELGSMMRAVVCAHELGHDMLHRELAAGGIRESSFLLEGNKTEREANLFAACVLISDKDILSEMEYGGSIQTLAFELNVPPQIVRYKLMTLNYKGYNFNVDDVESDFLKD